LIVNADDFGQSLGVNTGVMQAHAGGIVTSASLLVRHPHARDAVRRARGCPRLSLGLHLDLGEWEQRGDDWMPLYQVVPLNDPAAVREEIARQLEAFRVLTGAEPTHLDSHQHVHAREPVRSVLAEAARRVGVPLRSCTCGVRYCGEFYGQSSGGEPCPDRISPRHLIDMLQRLGPGVTELGCHPAAASDMRGMYTSERMRELDTLCDAAVRRALSQMSIRLISFADLGSLARAGTPAEATRPSPHRN
jgi:predicted glycoside hydrolase/deacetylase ChbG (UPF0249 family)